MLGITLTMQSTPASRAASSASRRDSLAVCTSPVVGPSGPCQAAAVSMCATPGRTSLAPPEKPVLLCGRMLPMRMRTSAARNSLLRLIGVPRLVSPTDSQLAQEKCERSSKRLAMSSPTLRTKSSRVIWR